MALLSLFPILGYALFIHFQFKKVISVSLFFAITSIISVLFLFGLLSLLQFGANLLFYLGLLLLGYTFYRYRQEFAGVIVQPPLAIFLFFSVLAFFAFKDVHLFFWDEYSHWGAFIKEMFYFHHFYDAASVAAHINYPPGVSTWDYFILLHSDYHEGVLYFAYFLILFASTLMMYEKITWDKWYWLLLVFAVQMVLFASFGHWFSNIYVDHVIGALFAGLVLSYLAERYATKELLLFVFPLVSIVLVKEVGLYFGFAAVGLYALLLFVDTKRKELSILQTLTLQKSNFALLFMLLAIMLLTLKVWSLHQESKGIKGEKQSITGIVTSVISDENVLSEPVETRVKENFWNVVLHQQLHKEKLSLNYNEFSVSTMPQYKKVIKLSTVGVLVFFIAMIVMAHKLSVPAEKKREVGLLGGYLIFVFLVYLIILYMSYLVAFGSGAVRIPSYVRYINMATLPLMFVAFSLLLPFYQNNTGSNKNKIATPLTGGIAALVLLGLITQPYFKPLYTQLESQIRSQVEPVTTQIVANVPSHAKLFVVFPVKNNGMINYILRYSLIPAQSTVSRADFGELSSEQMQSTFGQYDYVWFAAFNQSTIDKNRTLLKAKTQKSPYTLYKVERNNSDIALTPIL